MKFLRKEKSSKSRKQHTRKLGFENLEERRVLSASSILPGALAEPIATVAEVPPASLSPASLSRASLTLTAISSSSGKEFVQSLTYQQFSQLTPDQVVDLLPEQLSTIPHINHFASWSPESRKALSVPQINSLPLDVLGIGLLTDQQVSELGESQIQSMVVGTTQLRRLSSTQISWLTTPQIQQLHYWDFPSLPPSQIPNLTTAQIASIPARQNLIPWTVAARNVLSQAQVQALNIQKVGIDQLNSTQMGWLTTSQIRSTVYWDFDILKPEQIPSLTTAQLNSIPARQNFAQWSSAARAALTPAQVQVLKVATLHIDLLPGRQISWMSAVQIRSLSSVDFRHLRLNQISMLSAAQLNSITTREHFVAMSAASRGRISAVRVRSLRVDRLGIDLLTDRQVIELDRSQIQSMAVGTTQLRRLSQNQIAWLTSSQIQKLHYWDFPSLPVSQIPKLSTNQIASIPARQNLILWTVAARNALTQAQVQAFNIQKVGIDQLNKTQMGWLTTSQIRSTVYWDFDSLKPNQIPSLTTAQIASIPARQNLVQWTSAARNALTSAQVQALNVATVQLDLLSSEQVGWLTATQIRSIQPLDFRNLQLSQLKILAPSQFAELENIQALTWMTDQARAQLSREQILSLPLDIYESFTGIPLNTRALSNFVPMSFYTPAADGLAGDPRTLNERNAILRLVPHEAATNVSVASGNWSDPSVWQNGRVPNRGADVLIASGNNVTFDAMMTESINTLRVDGLLKFAHNRNTQLMVDTIVVDTLGELSIGTALQPIASHVTARIVFPTGEAIDTSWDPKLLSRGIVGRGTVRMFGAQVTPYASLSIDPSAGDTTLWLDQGPTNWQVGDRLVLTGNSPSSTDFQSEEVTIRSVSGRRVEIDPLRYNHKTPAGFGLSMYVANLSRNIELTADNPNAIAAVRPHIMFAHNPDVQIENAGIYGFGRTDKSLAIDKSVQGLNGPQNNARGRYSLHFHRTGVDPNSVPATVRGSVVVGSPGWGFTNHQSHVLFEDNVAFQVNGASFVTEDGNEVGAFTRNLAIATTGTNQSVRTRHATHDFGHAGNGFWLQGPAVELVDNIVAGASSDAFLIYSASSRVMFAGNELEDPAMAGGQDVVPVSAIPLSRFEGNLAFAATSGLETWYINRKMTDEMSTVDDLTVWNVTDPGIFLEYSDRLTIRDGLLLGIQNDAIPGIYSGPGTGGVTFDNVHIEKFDIGIRAPVRGTNQLLGGHFKATTAIQIPGAYDTVRSLTISGNPVFETLTAQELKGRQQWDIYLSENSVLRYRSEDALTSKDSLQLLGQGTTEYQFSFNQQLADFVPFPSVAARTVRPEWQNLTNQQLQDRFGIAYAGAVVPNSAVQLPRIFGWATQI